MNLQKTTTAVLLLLVACTFGGSPKAQAELLLKRTTRQNMHGRDFAAAVLRQRPIAKSIPSTEQLSTFKGFSYEQSLLRRLNARPGENGQVRFAPANDEIADLIRIGNGQRPIGIQVYGGHSAKAAFEKLLGSDAAADELIVPRDVAKRMKTAVDEAEAVFRQFKDGQLDETSTRRQIRNRLRATGLTLDDETFRIGMTSKGQRLPMGNLGSSEIAGALNKVQADSLTSTQVMNNTLAGLMDPTANTSLGRFAKLLSVGDSNSIKGVQAILQQRAETYKRRGHNHYRAYQKAGNWFRYTEAPRLRMETDLAFRRAEALGVTPESVQKINLTTLPADPIQRTAAIKHELNLLSRNASIRQHAVGQGVAAIFFLAGSGVDLYFSGESVGDWLKSDRGKEWAARGVLTSSIVSASIGLERKLAAEAVENGVKKQGGQVVQFFGKTAGRRLLVVGGVAGAMFVGGESLIQVIAYDQSFAEISGQLYESIAVMAVTEAAGFGVYTLLASGSYGSFAGPMGIAVAVGLAVTYEGVKYVWSSRKDLTISTKLLTLRCDLAQRKSQGFYQRIASSDATASVD